MGKVEQITRNGETQFRVVDLEGISVGDLYEILSRAIANNPAILGALVALCLQEVGTGTTRITSACNEGDDSVFWLSLSPEAEKLAKVGFDRSEL